MEKITKLPQLYAAAAFVFSMKNYTRNKCNFSVTVAVTVFSTSSSLSTLCKDLRQTMDQVSYILVTFYSHTKGT